MAKGMSIDECVLNAEKFIQNRGICLLLFDVKGSRTFKNKDDFVRTLSDMMSDINLKFDEYFPINELAVYSRKEKGFQYRIGDGSWAGINSANIIPEIIKYQEKNYPNIPLYWGVAQDGFDDDGIKLVK